MRGWRTIAGKMWITLGILIGAYFVSLLVEWGSGRRTEARLSAIADSLFPAASQSQVALSRFQEGTRLYQDAVMTGETSLLATASAKLGEAGAALQAILAMPAVDPIRWPDVLSLRKRIVAYGDAAGALYGAMTTAGSESAAEGSGPDREGEAASLAKEAEGVGDALRALAAGLADDVRADLRGIGAQTRRQRHFVTGIFLLSVAVAAGLVSLILARWVVNPMRQASRFAETMARGDFTGRIEVTQDDEVGRLQAGLSSMAGNLNDLVGQVQQSGIQVTSSATELAAVARQQEATIAQQVESTDRAAGAVSQIAGVAASLVETMQEVSARSNQTAEFATNGRADLLRMETAMRELKAASESIVSRMAAMNEKTESITDIVTAITRVASQTNLLSLNAAIEAVKAGVYGKGFTVVAEEIRRLADQTAVAALEIEGSVTAMREAVGSGLSELQTFVKAVQTNVETIGRVGAQLTRIVEQVQALSPSFEEVNVAMGEQAGKATEINVAMTSLNADMRQVMESVRQSYAAIEQLNEAAMGLQRGVSRFRVRGRPPPRKADAGLADGGEGTA